MQTFSNRHLTVGLDGIVEMSEEDAACLISLLVGSSSQMELRRGSSTPPDAASQVPKFCEPSEIRSAPRETSGDRGFESISLQRRVKRTPYPGARRAPPPARLGRRPNTIIVAGIGLKEMKPGSGGNLH